MLILKWKTEELREKSLTATMSTTNPTWTDLGTNPGLCTERLTADCLMAWP
jgi:hypothetical protein